MKNLKKFNETKNLVVIGIPDDYFPKVISILFDNDDSAKKFILNKCYNLSKDSEEELDILDETIDGSLEEIHDMYMEMYYNNAYDTERLSYQYVNITDGKLDDWIQLRLNTQKYNL